MEVKSPDHWLTHISQKNRTNFLNSIQEQESSVDPFLKENQVSSKSMKVVVLPIFFFKILLFVPNSLVFFLL